MDIKDVITKMVANGEDDSVIKAVIQKYNDGLQSKPIEYDDPTANDIMSMVNQQKDVSFKDIGKEIAVNADPYVRAGLVGGGGIIGAGAGSPGGALGMAAGGTLGASIGEQLADRYSEAVGTKEPPKDLPGAFSEAGQQMLHNAEFNVGVPAGIATLSEVANVASPAVKAVGRNLAQYNPFSKSSSRLRAGKMLLSALKDGEEIDTSQLAELSKEIPGLRFITGEGGEPGVKQLSGQVLGMDKIRAAKELDELNAHNKKVLYDYFNKHFTHSGEDAGELLSLLKNQKARLDAGEQLAADEVAKLGKSIEARGPSDAVGLHQKEILQQAKDLAKEKIDELYKALPRDEIKDISGIRKDLIALKKTMQDNPLTKERAPISEVDAILQNLTHQPKNPELWINKPPLTNATVEEMRLQAQDIKKLAREAAANKQFIRAKKLLELHSILMKPIEEASGSQYADVKNAYRRYAETFKDGPVGKILAPVGADMDAFKTVLDSDVTKTLFDSKHPEKSKQLVDAVGFDKAQEMAREAILTKMYNNGKATEKSVTNFIKDNKALLDNFHLNDEFSGYEAVYKKLSEAANNNKAFQDMAVAKALGKDPTEAIANIYKGGDKASTTKKLLREISKLGGNKAALNGFKNALTDYISHDEFGNLSLDTLLKKSKEFDPAIKILYNDTERKAMYNLRKALKLADVKLGGGAFDSGQGKSNMLVDTVAPFLLNKYSKIVAFKNMAKMLTGKGFADEVELLYKAALDPKLAKELIDGANASAAAEGASSIGNVMVKQPPSPFKYFKGNGLMTPENSNHLRFNLSDTGIKPDRTGLMR